ncbi:MAG TPA: DUF2971 domain-containing protein [Xanthobacteraceae bacterium]|nr:DUF2971 domain-containing protein [Xanthobacteraceae bacterium]
MIDKPYEPPSFTEPFLKAPPGILFHYTGQMGLLGIVHNKELWATKIQYMNDATEFGLALNLARQHLRNIIQYSRFPLDKSAGATLLQSLDGLERINIFAACFCEQGDLLSQWRGYGGGQQGYAIGFTTDALMQIADRHGFRLGACIYDPATQQKIIDEAVAHCLQNEHSFNTNRHWGFHGPLADILFRCGVFFKDPAFKDEKEWRLVSPTILYDDERMRFRTGRSMIAPYYALPVENAGALPINCVIVGPCPHIDLSKSAVETLLMRHGNRAPLTGGQVAIGSAVPFRDW